MLLGIIVNIVLLLRLKYGMQVITCIPYFSLNFINFGLNRIFKQLHNKTMINLNS